MTWSDIWYELTGEDTASVEVNAIRTLEGSTKVDFVESFNPGSFKGQKGTWLARTIWIGLILVCKNTQELGSPYLNRSSSLYGVFTDAEHQSETPSRPSMAAKYQQGCELLQFASRCHWDQIERAMFFPHEHQATASSCQGSMEQLAVHPGVYVIVSDMRRWGMRVRDEISEDQNQAYLIKKPTKWMTNCRPTGRIVISSM